MNKTQADQIADYFMTLNQQQFAIQEVYKAFSDFPKPSIRRVLRRDTKKRFKAIAKGIYILTKGNAQAVLIQGDSRSLELIEDNSVECIIADHPWLDKKANKGGNRNFTEGYEPTAFLYTEDDFKHKARILKEGCYLIEMLPTESATNFEYLYAIKKMALACGFQYYAKILWQKNPSNTGRTVKEFEDIMIFSKGKARRLNDNSKLPYATKEMLKQRIHAPVPKRKDLKNHPAEKPVELWEYLIEMLTNPFDTIIEQFGGACNMIQAALNTNRNVVVFELIENYVQKASERFCMQKDDTLLI